jgi:carboxymethylenebutenolidase
MKSIAVKTLIAGITFVFSSLTYAGWGSSDKKTPDQTVEVINHQGELLRAYLWMPDNYNPQLSYPSVVLAHGCGGAHYKDAPEQWIAKYVSGKYKVWGKLLNQEQIMVLMVDSFTTRDVNGDVGAGVCDVDYDMRPAKIDPISVRPADIAAGIHYLKQRADVDANKVGVMGFSNGGTAALALSNHQSLDARAFDLIQQQKSWFDLPFIDAYKAHTMISLYPGCGMTGYDETTTGLFDSVFQTYTDTFIYAASDDSTLPGDTLAKCSNLRQLDAPFGDLSLNIIANTDHQFDYYENNELPVTSTIARILSLFKSM